MELSALLLQKSQTLDRNWPTQILKKGNDHTLQNGTSLRTFGDWLIEMYTPIL